MCHSYILWSGSCSLFKIKMEKSRIYLCERDRRLCNDTPAKVQTLYKSRGGNIFIPPGNVIRARCGSLVKNDPIFTVSNLLIIKINFSQPSKK